MHAYFMPAIQVLINSSSIMTKEGKLILWQVDTNYNIIFVTNLWFECEGCTYSMHVSIIFINKYELKICKCQM